MDTCPFCKASLITPARKMDQTMFEYVVKDNPEHKVVMMNTDEIVINDNGVEFVRKDLFEKNKAKYITIVVPSLSKDDKELKTAGTNLDPLAKK